MTEPKLDVKPDRTVLFLGLAAMAFFGGVFLLGVSVAWGNPMFMGMLQFLATAVPLLLVLALVGLLAGVALHFRRQHLLPTADGRVPLASPYMQEYFEWLKVRDLQPGATVPHHLSLNYRHDQRLAMGQEGTVHPVAALTAPTMSEIMSLPGALIGTAIEDGRRIHDGGKPLSFGIGGRPGTGKSTTAASYASMLRLRDPKTEIYVGDLHGLDGESLGARLQKMSGPLPTRNLATDAPGCLELVDRVHAIMQRRIEGRDTSRSAQLLLIDEWTSLIRRPEAAQLLARLEDIAQQGRKFGVGCLLMAQDWAAAAVGSTQLRNPLGVAIVHAMRPDAARNLTGPGVDLSDVRTLGPGEAYLVRDTVERIRVPDPSTMPSNALQVPSARSNGALEEPGWTATGRHWTADGRQPDGIDVEESQRIRQLALESPDPTWIIKQVWGLDPNGGRPYRERKDQVVALIRSLLTPAKEQA